MKMVSEDRRVKRLEQVREAVKRKRLQIEYCEEERYRKRMRYHFKKGAKRECEDVSMNNRLLRSQVISEELRNKRRKSIRDIVKRRRESVEVRKREREKDREAKQKKRAIIRLKQMHNQRVKTYRRKVQLSNEQLVVENFKHCKYLKRKTVFENFQWLLNTVKDYRQVDRMVKLGLVQSICNVIHYNISHRYIITTGLGVISTILEHRVFQRDWVKLICTEGVKCGWVSMCLIIMKRYNEEEIIEVCLDILGVLTGNEGICLKAILGEECSIIRLLDQHKGGRMVLANGMLLLTNIVRCISGCGYVDICLFLVNVFKTLPTGRYGRVVAHCAMQLISALIVQSKYKRLLISMGIKSIVKDYYNFNVGKCYDVKFSLMTSIATRVWNDLNE
jgi:hypothetical protein